MKNLFTIGEIASIFGETKETFRHYDRVGLLKPCLVKKNKYRYYSLDQFEMISTILHLRSIGTPIDRIIDLLHSSSKKSISEELRKQREQLHEQIERMKYLEYQASRLLDRFENFDTEKIEHKVEPTFYILRQDFSDKKLGIDPGHIVSFHQNISSEWLKYSNIISIIKGENLYKQFFHEYASYGILSEEACEEANAFYYEIPSRLYVTGCIQILSFNHEEIDDLYVRMLQYIDHEELIIDGDCFERNILDLYNEKAEGDIHYIKVYIPVRKAGNED